MAAAKGVAAAAAATVTATAMLLFAMMGDGGSGGVALAESDCGKPPGEGSSLPNQTYGSNEPSSQAVEDIPSDYLEIYRSAGQDYGLDWTYLAAIGKIETDHGRYGGGGCATGPDTAYGNAQGPMQFIPSTWSSVGVDGDGDGTADPCNPRDAIPAAANYLKQSGAPGDWYGAIYAYNHADWYVQDVMAQADAYRSADPGGGGSDQAAAPGPVDKGAIAAAALDALPPAHLESLADTLRGKVGTETASAETLDWNLLNGDKTLSYSDHTAYDSALQAGVSAWNAVGVISIEPGGGDVQVGDTSTQESILGRTSSDGTLVFNAPQMDASTQNAQNATASHELGHAMGLAHTSSPSVMNTPIIRNSTSNHEDPTDFDVQELSGLWGGPSGGGEDPSGGGEQQYDDDDGGGNTPDGGGTPDEPPSPDGGGVDDFYGGLFGNDNDGGGGSEDPPNNFDSSDGGDDDGVQINREVQRNGVSGDGGGDSSPDGSLGPIEDDEDWPFSILDGGDGGGVDDPSGDGGGGGDGGKKGGKKGGKNQDDGSGGSEDPSGAEDQQYDGGQQYHGGQYGGGNPSGGGGGEPIACPDPGPGEGGDPSGNEPSGGNNPSGGGTTSGDGQAVVAEAEKHLGVPYVLGGPEVCKPGEIMDCTCLTTTAYRAFGYELTDSPAGQMGYGEPVQGELQPGDITFYAEHGDGIISHVGISMGGNKIIHASSWLGEVGYTEDHSYIQGYVGARRLLN